MLNKYMPAKAIKSIRGILRIRLIGLFWQQRKSEICLLQQLYY